MDYRGEKTNAAVSAMLVAAVLTGGVAHASSSDAAEILAGRSDEKSSVVAIRRLVKLSEREPTLVVCSSLLRARHLFAQTYLSESARVTAAQQNLVDGLRALSRHLGIPLDEFDALDDMLAGLKSDVVPLLYWTTIAYGRTVESMSVFSQPFAAGRFERALRRTVQLDGAYFYGGPRRSLALYLAQAPGIMGGDDVEAVTQAKQAIKDAPIFADNHLQLAEVLRIVDAPTSEYRTALLQAVTASRQAMKDCAPEQVAAGREASAMLAKVPE